MAFAAHTGVSIDLDAPQNGDDPLALLFNEELGAVVQVRAEARDHVLESFERHGLSAATIGWPNTNDRIRIEHRGKTILDEPRISLQRVWSETTWQMQTLRDNPECALQEYDRILDAGDPGISPRLTFDPAEDFAATYIAHGARPRMAILREQGVNSQVEMAAAFDRAGFESYDVHMSDIISGRVSLAGFRGFVACGGFSYGDVLGGGDGWAKSILFNARARDEFAAFFARHDTFAVGMCNGCQMMGSLKELIPGAEGWPRFVKNTSEQFEARLVTVEIVESPSIVFRGMAGSRIPIVTAHGEGRALFENDAGIDEAIVSMRYVDNRGLATEVYPLNPNGSPRGITGVTTADGRFTIVMPHPERVFRTVQLSWHPDEWGEDSPWMRLFRNAREWVG
jgi:phosphoribosylformylglycinamidine synthase